MEQYKFDPVHSKMIVDSVVEGYRDYVEHRKDRKQKMKISSAFAWTKGNFIESKVAEECVNHGFKYKQSKAGLTWDYLQFINGDKKSLFLIKNAAYFNEKCFSQSSTPIQSKKGQPRTYLKELSLINKDLEISAETMEIPKSEQLVQLEFFVSFHRAKEELESLKSSFTEFHILTYTIDEAYQISKIKHYLPNPHDNVAHLVEDLSFLISGAELSELDREIIAPIANEELYDPEDYDIGIIGEEDFND